MGRVAESDFLVDQIILMAAELASRPGFDSLHDPNPATKLIEPYHDPVGFPTQGYGHLLSREKWADLSQWPGVTSGQAFDWLMEDIGRAYSSVRRIIRAKITPEMAAALTDFAFNCGAGNLQISTLARMVNRGDFIDAADQFGRWVNAGGVKMPGLVRRRAAERELFISGI